MPIIYTDTHGNNVDLTSLDADPFDLDDDAAGKRAGMSHAEIPVSGGAVCAICGPLSHDDVDPQFHPLTWIENSIICSICHRRSAESTAHRHQNKFIGECCWDERLRATE